VAGWRGQTGRIREEKEEEQLVDIREDFSATQVHLNRGWHKGRKGWEQTGRIREDKEEEQLVDIREDFSATQVHLYGGC
jgi:hypothetical protein